MPNIKYANELRITNIVSFPIEKSGQNSYYENSMIVKISQLYASAFILGEGPSKHYETPIPKIIPIILTDEWLKKLGFEKVNENSFKNGNYLVYLLPNGSGEFDFYFCGKLIATRFYVHELQNLYYSIDNKELECQLS